MDWDAYAKLLELSLMRYYENIRHEVNVLLHLLQSFPAGTDETFRIIRKLEDGTRRVMIAANTHVGYDNVFRDNRRVFCEYAHDIEQRAVALVNLMMDYAEHVARVFGRDPERYRMEKEAHEKLLQTSMRRMATFTMHAEDQFRKDCA